MKIAPDKKRHFWAGLLMGILVQAALLWLLPGKTGCSILLAAGIVIGISYGFELFSKWTGHGYYEIMDAVYTIAGGALGIGLTLLAITIT